MEGYEAATYGDRISEIYDRLYGTAFDVEATVAFLKELAGRGRALELAVGTGRVALPLAEAGVEVLGIDASPAMVAQMRAKPGGDRLPVTMGDFADVAVEGAFSLIYVVFNTLFALTTQEDQVRCFANAAAHLEPGGAFVIEAFVPDLARFDQDQRVHAAEIGLDEVMLDVSMHSARDQTVTSQHVVVRNGDIKLFPVHLRYSWPSELDLMARLAGLRLRERWAGWRRDRFSSSSGGHVSVYELPLERRDGD
jgi:SAM-dependent methyltransferase